MLSMELFEWENDSLVVLDVEVEGYQSKRQATDTLILVTASAT